MISSIAQSEEFKHLVTIMERPDPVAGAPEKTEDQEEAATASTISFGVDVVKLIIDKLDGEASKWFADLIGVNDEEFLELDFDIELDILEQLSESKTFAGFFSKASRLYNRIKKSRGTSKDEKTQSDSETDSQNETSEN